MVTPRRLALCLAAAAFAACVAAGDARAERVLYASADGKGGYFNGVRIAADDLATVLKRVRGRLTEKTVIQLLTSTPDGAAPTAFRVEKDPCNFQIARVRGSAANPLIVRGVKKNGRWLTQIAGDTIDDIVAKKFSCRRAVAEIRGPAPSGTTSPGGLRDDLAQRLHRAGASLADVPDGVARLGAGDQYRMIRCFHVVRSRHIAFEDIHFKDCWVSAVFIADSSDVRVAGNLFEGSSYAVFATALRLPLASVRGFAIENNIWVQDNSGYGPGKPAPCKEVGAAPEALSGCPGLMWTTIPWAVSHDTWYEHMNGGLFGSLDIGGGVIFRGNKVTSAYNGIRMVTSPACYRIRACRDSANRDVEIVDNDFVHIRDNPVEPEHRAVNWTIAKNRIKNSHAWFSLDDVSGGPIYIWGNVGWYTDIPGRECVDEAKFRLLVRVDFENGGYRTLERVSEAQAAFTCARSRYGTIIKEGSEGEALDKDIYVFNNSWYVRIPILREAKSGRIKYWNNAMHFTGCGVSADRDSLCGIELSAGLEGCRGYRDYASDDGQSLLLRCVDPGQVADPRVYDFRYNLSNKGFPAAFLAAPGRKDVGIAADPRFRAPEKGDFRLRSDSPAIGRGCVVEWQDRARTALRCREPGPGTEDRVDIGAYTRSGKLYAGPK